MNNWGKDKGKQEKGMGERRRGEVERGKDIENINRRPESDTKREDEPSEDICLLSQAALRRMPLCLTSNSGMITPLFNLSFSVSTKNR